MKVARCAHDGWVDVSSEVDVVEMEGVTDIERSISSAPRQPRLSFPIRILEPKDLQHIDVLRFHSQYTIRQDSSQHCPVYQHNHVEAQDSSTREAGH